MIKKKIIQFSTYPIVGTQTGGPLRVRAINSLYNQYFTDAKHVAIFSKYHHPIDYLPTDIAVSGELAEMTRTAPNTSDYLIGEAIASDPDLHKKLLDLLLEYRPDVVEVEQVFPYIGLKTVLEELPFKPKLVYSSHNVEYSMKNDILLSLGHDKQERERMVAALRQTETELCQRADLVAVCTKADGESLKKLGAKRYILARNGVSEPHPAEADKQYWHAYFAKRAIEKIAVFMGAAHPPNMIGFHEMISTGMGFLPAGYAIVLAGGVGVNIMENLRPDSMADVTCHRRLLSVGWISDERRDGLIAIADTILLPIVEGGGSNLKTAQALFSGRPVVATSKALRSFEEYQGLPTLRIADKPDDFRTTIRTAMSAPAIALTEQQVRFTRALLWDNCLHEMAEAVAQL
jgi:glycosyltransferase involved in cell wall biosynthesis